MIKRVAPCQQILDHGDFVLTLAPPKIAM